MTTKICVPMTLTHQHEDGSTDVYKRHEELGRGGFAAVYRVTHVQTGKDFALKAIAKDRYIKPKSMAKLKSEISIQKSLDHPNILKSFSSFTDTFNYYIIIELCPGQSIKDLVRRQGHLSESETARILRDVIEGLCYLHDNRIIHRDLKLENFLIGADGKVKIADFGLSTKLDYDDERKYTICGTPNYLSPELLLSANKGHSYEVDIWTIGVAAFAMLTGRPPFETTRTKLTYEHIKNCQYHFPVGIRISETAKDFVRVILRIRPERRPNAQDLAMHPFLAKPSEQPKPKDLPKPVDAPKVVEAPKQKIEPKNYILDERKKIEQQRRKLENIQQKDPPKYGYQRQKADLQKPRAENQIVPYKAENLKNNKRANERAPLKQNCVENNIINIAPAKAQEEIDEVILPKYCVSRFCEHRTGLGYLLIDGTVGACFEDQSRMVMDPFETFVQYYPNYETTTPEILDFQNEVEQKKLALLKRFSSSLKKIQSMYDLPEEKYDQSENMHHVKYWIRNDDATLFRLDDKNIQVNFNDHRKVFIYWSTKKMTVVHNIKGSGCLHSLSDVNNMSAKADEYKRFIIAKAMLDELSRR